MVNLSFILGIIGNVISVLMFASPIKTFKEVVKKRSTENYKGLPYIITLLSASLWTFYGMLKPGGLLIATVNGVGAAIHIVYVGLFLIYAPKNVKVQSLYTVAVLDVGFLGGVIAVALLAFHGGLRLTIIGLLCTGLTIGMYAAPLSAMRMVVKMKSVQYMPFTLSFFQFLNGGVWSAYAVIVKDFYIGVPNGAGFLLGSAQLILYMIYRGKSTLEVADQKIEDDDNIDNLKMMKTSLHKEEEYSLPRPPNAIQYSPNIVKTRSLSPVELQKLKEEVIEREGLKKAVDDISSFT